jgi:hypothetical protein
LEHSKLSQDSNRPETSWTSSDYAPGATPALLGFVILTGYIPAFIDANDMIFGLFRRTWYATACIWFRRCGPRPRQ